MGTALAGGIYRKKKSIFFFLCYHYLILPIMYNKELAFWSLCPGDRFLGGYYVLY